MKSRGEKLTGVWYDYLTEKCVSVHRFVTVFRRLCMSKLPLEICCRVVFSL